MYFKIIKGEILSKCRFFLLSDCMQTRRHMCKLYKRQASVNAYKVFFSKGQIPLRYPARELVADQLATSSNRACRDSSNLVSDRFATSSRAG